MNWHTGGEGNRFRRRLPSVRNVSAVAAMGKVMTGSANRDVHKVEVSDSVLSDKRPRGRRPGVATQRLRPDNHYVLDLIEVLQAFPSGRRRWSIMQAIRANRTKAGLSIPHQIEDDVERAFLDNCADAESFKKRNRTPVHALFYWPQGKTAGMWAVYTDRVAAWMRENIPLL
jgi:hypothetical protein